MEVFLGQIILVPYNFVPMGFLPCDGRSLPIAQYQALFSLLGTQFGGDGMQTFCLPTLAPITVGAGKLTYAIAMQGIYPSRD
jgi:microcystin-dependent protein